MAERGERQRRQWEERDEMARFSVLYPEFQINTKIGSVLKILEKQVRCKCVLGIIQFTFTHLQQKKYVQK